MDLLDKFGKHLTNLVEYSKENGPQIGVTLGIGGFVASLFMVGTAAPKARDICYEVDEELDALIDEGEYISKAERIWEKTKAAGPLFLPAAITAVASGFVIIKSFDEEAQRLSTLAVAYDVVEAQRRREKEYYERELGADRVKEIDKLVEAKRKDDEEEAKKKDTPLAKSIYLDNKILFRDPIQTSLYFYSTKEDIQKVLRSLSERFNYQVTVSYNDWCYEIDENGIGSSGDDLIWENPKDIDVRYGQPEMTPDGLHVCIPIIFWREPKRV